MPFQILTKMQFKAAISVIIFLLNLDIIAALPHLGSDDVLSLGNSVPVAVTVPIMRRKHHNMTRLSRAILGMKHTINKYRLHFNKTKDAVFKIIEPGSAPLANIRNEFFSAPVTIGTGQEFLMDLDTGSSDTWVRGSNCKAGAKDRAAKLDSCRGAKFDVTDAAVTPTKSKYVTTYGSGEVRGSIYKSDVSIAGLSANIPIGVSDYEEGFDDGGASDGLLGLGFNSISTISAKIWQSASFIDGLKLSGSSNMFAFYFSNYNDHDKGEVTIGGYDSSKIADPITWIPLTDKSYWQFSWKKATASVNGQTFNAVDISKSAIADTGTTLIVLDDSVALSINTALGAKFDTHQGAFLFADCKTAKTRPSLEFTFGGATFSIPASVYTFLDAGSGICFSGISGGASQQIILGDIFLRQYYSIYDKNKSRVGFALAKHPSP